MHTQIGNDFETAESPRRFSLCTPTALSFRELFVNEFVHSSAVLSGTDFK